MSIPQSPTLAKVAKGDLCTGCGLCAGIGQGAITMETVAPGYTRPRQIAPITPALENTIKTACPGSVVGPWTEAPHRHPYWGPYYQSLTGYATDPKVRYAGSSGGGITSLALFALETGLVDRVLHVLPDPAHPTRNVMAWSDRPEDVITGAGSRYAPSSPLGQIEEALADGRRFVFIGKPCDVAALRQLATVDARVDQQIPLMLSFYCAGIPSHAAADKVIRAMGLEPEKVTSFRYRGNGWPGLTIARTDDGQQGEMRYAESWGKHLSGQVQYRCKICPDGVGGAADIACADAWYGDDGGYPQFEEQDGRSLIMSRTARGDALLRKAIEAGRVAVEPLDVNDIDHMQPGQTRRKRVLIARLAAAMVTFQPRPVMDGLDIGLASKRAGMQEKLKNFVGSVRRIVTNRRH
ncbi:hypothetical protein EOE18_10300 [Novosphingobium umbonatum]|uniref:Coenzyme F420 hydrogenase n=1 Tax=Novosphingobium umbonatum TaxID=1908524 RepID=A0A3S2USH3_9SPHN|nr:Coenzyme F420 hydrogenase/dehydrogenase, beta subunit C-terminal domain [Novosphingobium umbonatum]RVU05108.1 hypothetical protein EOE18_10300 [Novosphingobium umbonatum]